MLKYILELILFFFIGIGILFLVNIKYKETKHYISRYEDILKLRNISSNIEIANIGSSHGRDSFSYDKIKMNSFNFGMGSKNYYYDLLLLKEYKENFSKGAMVFIPVSYGSFGSFNSELYKKRERDYALIFSLKEIYNVDLLDYVLVKYFPILISKKLFRYIVLDIKSKMPVYKTCDHNLFKDRIDEIAHKKYLSQKDLFNIDQETVATLEEIIIFMKKNDITPILVTTPILKNLFDYYSEDFLNEFYSQISYFVDKYDIDYMDYSQDKRFYKSIDLFIDSDHLNAKGREVFSDIVLKNVGDKNAF